MQALSQQNKKQKQCSKGNERSIIKMMFMVLLTFLPACVNVRWDHSWKAIIVYISPRFLCAWISAHFRESGKAVPWQTHGIVFCPIYLCIYLFLSPGGLSTHKSSLTKSPHLCPIEAMGSNCQRVRIFGLKLGYLSTQAISTFWAELASVFIILKV